MDTRSSLPHPVMPRRSPLCTPKAGAALTAVSIQTSFSTVRSSRSACDSGRSGCRRRIRSGGASSEPWLTASSWDSRVCCSMPSRHGVRSSTTCTSSRCTKDRASARVLLSASRDWVARAAPGEPMHLWVMEGNLPARRFYDRQGGTVAERTIVDDGPAKGLPVVRYVWPPL